MSAQTYKGETDECLFIVLTVESPTKLANVTYIINHCCQSLVFLIMIFELFFWYLRMGNTRINDCRIQIIEVLIKYNEKYFIFATMWVGMLL